MRVAGIDVNKKVSMIVIRDNGEETTEEMRQKFITTRSGLREVAAWLQTQQVEAVVMESTAQYWWPVWIELEDKFALHLVQARSNAAPDAPKTDFADARRLARRFFSHDLRYSFVPDAEQRRWRRLTRTWTSLGQQIVEATNEMEAMLEEGQIKLSGYLSDLARNDRPPHAGRACRRQTGCRCYRSAEALQRARLHGRIGRCRGWMFKRDTPAGVRSTPGTY